MRKNNARNGFSLLFRRAFASTGVFFMADEKEEILETEGDRRKQYRKLRAGGMSDGKAMEKVWPTTSAGLKINVDEKAKDASDRAAKEVGAPKGKKEK
jgi:hypothetical protein